MTPNFIEGIAIAKLKKTTLSQGEFQRHIDDRGRVLLLVNAPDFPTARAIWKKRESLEVAISQLGFADYWQIRVGECPYTPLERIISSESTIEQLRQSFSEGSALKAASQFCKLSLLKHHLIVHAEHPGVACVLTSQECRMALANCAENLGIRRVSILASMETSQEWEMIKNASLQELRAWKAK